MACCECGRTRDTDERGWVIVLSPSGTRRIQYCPDCMTDLVLRTTTADELEDRSDDC
jgi:hypothetical protein